MKRSLWVFSLALVTTVLTGCQTNQSHPTRMASNFINREEIIHTTKETYPAKNPQRVAVFTPDKVPHIPYRIIGVATVSKYNMMGKKRSDATVHQMMKKLAASIGGDGLIDLNNNEETMKAKVIAFHRVLI